MKLLIVILFFIGIIITLIGYYQSKQNCPIRKTKYKFLPKTVEEEQAYGHSVYKIYRRMFLDPPILK